MATGRFVPPSVYIPGHAVHEKSLQRQRGDGATGGVEGAAVRGPAVGGAAWGYPGYPVLTRHGGSHLELETLGKGTLPL